MTKSVGETFGRWPGPPGPRIALVCSRGPDVVLTSIKRLFEHTWNEHGRMPTKVERLPRCG